MATQLQVRNDTAANWTSANPTLLAGEIGFETSTNNFKIGNGTSAWTSLPYGNSSEAIVVLNTAYTLTNTTAAQKLFNNSTNGAVTLPVGTFQFECFYSLSSMSASNGSFGFALAGTATYTQSWWSIAQKGTATLATATATQSTYNTAANTTLATASLNTVGYAWIRGTLNITVAGTVIPQVSLGVGAAAVVGVGSYFRIGPFSSFNSTTNITIGSWS